MLIYYLSKTTLCGSKGKPMPNAVIFLEKSISMVYFKLLRFERCSIRRYRLLSSNTAETFVKLNSSHVHLLAGHGIAVSILSNKSLYSLICFRISLIFSSSNSISSPFVIKISFPSFIRLTQCARLLRMLNISMR